MKRFFNARVPVLLALVAMTGIGIGYALNFHGKDLFPIIAVIPVTAIIFILCALKIKRKSVPVLIVLAAVLFVSCTMHCFLKLESYANSELEDGGAYTVTATVCDKGENSAGEFLVLKNMSANGHKISGKAYAYLHGSYGDYADIGYKVSFKSNVQNYDVFAYGKLNYNAKTNIKYRFDVYYGLEAKRGFSVFGSIRNAVHDKLYNNLDKDTAGIAYAMLTGNTHGIDGQSLQGFRYGGIAHIFAVSGLHIGIVFGILLFITKRLRLNKFVAAAICLGCVFFYAGICGFTLSSLRAAVMCTVLTAAGLVYKKYDSLNALAVAAIVILLISPLNLFDIGFQLSLSAVFGICLLSKKIAKSMKKLPEKLASGIGASIGAQAGTLPAMLAGFGYVSGAGLILNIIVIPVLSVLFQLIFAAVLISLILPFAASALLPVAALPLEGVMSFITGCGFERAIIRGFGGGAFVPIFFIILIFVSDKLNMRTLRRVVAVGCAAVVLVTYVILKAFAPFSGYRICVSGYYGGGQVLIKSHGGNVLIITENLNTSRINQMLNDNYAFSVDAVIILGGEDCVTAFDSIEINCGSVIIYDDYIGIEPYGKVNVRYEHAFELFGADYEFYDGYNIKISLGGIDAGVCAGGAALDDCDLMICSAEYDTLRNARTVFFEGHGEGYNIYDCGSVTFQAEKGKLNKI